MATDLHACLPVGMGRVYIDSIPHNENLTHSWGQSTECGSEDDHHDLVDDQAVHIKGGTDWTHKACDPGVELGVGLKAVQGHGQGHLASTENEYSNHTSATCPDQIST